MIRKNLTITDSGFIIRTGNDIKFILEQTILHYKDLKNASILMKVQFQPTLATIRSKETCNIISAHEYNGSRIWRLTRNFQTTRSRIDSYILSEGDIIKIGKIEFKLCKYKLGETAKRTLTTKTDVEYNDIPMYFVLLYRASSESCRICYCSTKTIEIGRAHV